MFNLLLYYMLSAPPWTIYPHMDNSGGYILRPVSANHLMTDNISVGPLKNFNYTVISMTLTE